MRILIRIFITLIAVIGAIFLFLGQNPAKVTAELNITTTPSVTPTLFASDWSFLPHIQG